MGLDAIELVMSVEERFGIEIADEDASRIRTPRQLMDFVCHRVSVADEGKCLSQRSFYRVRRRLMAATGLARKDIGPGTPLQAIIPKSQSRTLWAELARSLGVQPRLRRAAWLSGAIVIASALVLAVPYWLAIQYHVAMTAAFAVLAVLLTRPAAVHLRGSVGDVAREAIPDLIRADRLERRATTWSRTEVAETVRGLIRDQLGLAEFSDDADFTKDLGMD